MLDDHEVEECCRIVASWKKEYGMVNDKLVPRNIGMYHTGGGCMCLVRTHHDGTYVLVTDMDGSGLPAWGDAWICVYDRIGAEYEWGDSPILEEVLCASQEDLDTHLDRIAAEHGGVKTLEPPA